MNTKRKLPVFCLAVIMVLTVLPRSAFANVEAAETPPVSAFYGCAGGKNQV